MRLRLAPWLLLVALGCRAAQSRQAAAVELPTVPLTLQARLPLAPGGPVGLSGLTRASDGTLWAVPERVRRLVPLKVQGLSVTARRAPIPIVGVAGGVDTESVAWLGDKTLAFGTETQSARGEDRILVVEVGEAARVTENIVLSYAGWGLRAAINRGVEGLCAADGVMFAGIEMILERGGRRLAPVARYSLAERVWSYGTVALASRTGKLSSLDCRPLDDDRLEVVALERHYGSAWLLRFTVPRRGPLGVLEPSAAVDLGALVPGVPNMEGVVFLPDDRLAVIIDNDTGGVSGPTELLLFAPPQP